MIVPNFRRIKVVVVAGLCLVALILFFQFGFTVMPTERVEDIRIAGQYDPETYVDQIWESSLIPTIEENAVELATILSSFAIDSDGNALRETLVPIAEQYGLITAGEAHVYTVYGEGRVVAVNLESRVGTLELDLAGYEGPTTVKLHIGPRIPSDDSSVRDAVGFINFGDFRDQTEYGRVAAAINRRINERVLEPLDKPALEGRTIAFQGAFAIRTFNLVRIDLSQITVTPIRISVEPD
jgi:predicted lipoprotein